MERLVQDPQVDPRRGADPGSAAFLLGDGVLVAPRGRLSGIAANHWPWGVGQARLVGHQPVGRSGVALSTY